MQTLIHVIIAVFALTVCFAQVLFVAIYLNQPFVIGFRFKPICLKQNIFVGSIQR